MPIDYKHGLPVFFKNCSCQFLLNDIYHQNQDHAICCQYSSLSLALQNIASASTTKLRMCNLNTNVGSILLCVCSLLHPSKFWMCTTIHLNLSDPHLEVTSYFNLPILFSFLNMISFFLALWKKMEADFKRRWKLKMSDVGFEDVMNFTLDI